MNRLMAWLASLAGVTVLGAVAVGQDVATPAVPATPAVTPAGAAPAAGAQKGGCLSGLGSLCGLAKGCKASCCDKPLGQLLNNAIKPFSMMTGGIVPNLCPSATEPSDSTQGKSSPAGSAADKIKQDQAEAKARRAAVRYLGTVDCHYYPEAEKALIASLRADRVECVRWEAAQSLGNGCCCTKKIIEALTITVTGSDKDGNPAETSPRVKAAAFCALQNCLARSPQGFAAPDTRPELPPQPESPPEVLPVPEPKRPEVPPPADGQTESAESGVHLVAYYETLDRKPASEVIAEARLALALLRPPPARVAAPPTGRRSLLEIWEHSAQGADSVEVAQARPPQDTRGPYRDAPLPPARPELWQPVDPRPERVSRTRRWEREPALTASRPGFDTGGPYRGPAAPGDRLASPPETYRPPYYAPPRPATAEPRYVAPATERNRVVGPGPELVSGEVRPAGWTDYPGADPSVGSYPPWYNDGREGRQSTPSEPENVVPARRIDRVPDAYGPWDRQPPPYAPYSQGYEPPPPPPSYHDRNAVGTEPPGGFGYR